MNPIELTLPEFLSAVPAAWLRMGVSKLKGYQDTVKVNTSGNYLKWFMGDLVGVLVEIAGAKWLDRFWMPGIQTFHYVADAGSDLEFRGTHWADGHLIFRKGDLPLNRFILGTVNLQDVQHIKLVGWLAGQSCIREEWWCNYKGMGWAYWVPQSELRPMEHLVEYNKLNPAPEPVLAETYDDRFIPDTGDGESPALPD